MQIHHKKRVLKLILFFLTALTFAVIEDIIAVAWVVDIGAVFNALPIIFIIALIFTFVAEYIEERFEPGKQPLEQAVEKLERQIIKKPKRGSREVSS